MVAIEAGDLLDVLAHPNQARYPGQRILVVRLNGTVHLVPYAEPDDHLFLKTIIPSRRDQRINIRLSSGDLQAIRTRALQEGIPYQTLISSVLHKYVSGTLQERVTVR